MRTSSSLNRVSNDGYIISHGSFEYNMQKRRMNWIYVNILPPKGSGLSSIHLNTEFIRDSNKMRAAFYPDFAWALETTAVPKKKRSWWSAKKNVCRWRGFHWQVKDWKALQGIFKDSTKKMLTHSTSMGLWYEAPNKIYTLQPSLFRELSRPCG